MSRKKRQQHSSNVDRESPDAIWDELGLYPAELNPQLAETMALEPPPSRPRFAPALFAVAATLVLLVGGYLLSSIERETLEVFATSLGERLVIHLTDGSVVQLNTSSRVGVSVDDRMRRIRVDRGEALFEVARDERRRFVVETPDGIVEALGTVFNVDLSRGQLVVSVAEGTVLVSDESDKQDARSVELVPAGEQAVINPDGLITRKALDNLTPVLAWTQGKIIFDGVTLESAVEQVNRYSRHRISILDERIRDLAVYGVFNSGDPDGFLSAVVKAYSIESQSGGEDHTYLVYRPDH